ncbi:MAG: TolC family protein [Phycisphaerales bacterium]|nr:TolC family protein [Phycisphaerales bacterium]
MPHPLSRDAVDAALDRPPLGELAQRYQASQHPLLPPCVIDPSDGIDPTEAACLAVVLNPDLRAGRAGRGLVAAQLIQAGLLPNPQFSASIDQPAGGATDGAVTAYGIGVDWEINALIEHNAALAAARADDRAAQLDMAWEEWQVACAARLAVVQAAWQDQIRQVLSQAAAGADAALGDLTRALDAGEATSLDVAAARSTLHGYQAQLREAERAGALAQLEVKRAIGLPPDATLVLRAPQVEAGAADSTLESAFRAARDRRLDLAALRLGYEAQEERVRQSILSQFPRLSLGLNGARDTGDVRTIGLGVSLELPIFDRGQGRIAGARATRARLFQEYVAREFALRADLGAILTELESLGPEIDSQAAALDASQSTLDIIERDAAQHLVDILSLEQLRTDVTDNRLALLALQQRRAELRVAFETESGSLAGGGGS